MNQRKVLQSSIKTGSPIKYQNRFFNQVSKQVLQSSIKTGSSIKYQNRFFNQESTKAPQSKNLYIKEIFNQGTFTHLQTF